MIGIIGFGRFGRLTAKNLSKDFEVIVYNRKDKAQKIIDCGARACDLATTCNQKIIIICVPISIMQNTLKMIGPMLQPDALVVDECSVKVYPAQWMNKLLPDTVSILATHPMFGPDSAADTLSGSKIVLCREKIKDQLYKRIKNWLSAQGLIIIETTPADHDRQIATTLSLTHFIGRALAEFGAKETKIDTEGYKRLLHILGVVQHDTWQLFVDMHNYNPYAKKKRLEFINAMVKLNDMLDQKYEKNKPEIKLDKDKIQ